MDRWIKDVEKIRQVTGLPIECFQTSDRNVEKLQTEQEEKGWELIIHTQENGVVWVVMIESIHWHASARALLSLFFTQPDEKTSLSDQLVLWLKGIASGNPIAMPHRLEQRWPWREERACFLLERSRIDSTFEWSSLQPLLHDFFKGNQVASPSLTFVPLNHSYLFLIVPLSMLGNQCEKEDLLEWASGMHDLIMTEWMENVRLLVGVAISTPIILDKTLKQLLSLSHALQQYRPRTMVAGSWLYPLERWAASLPPDASATISAHIHSLVPIPALNGEQLETLETLFSRQLNVSETARKLYLHRNTLLYRLDKLTELTGLDPRLFPDAVLLQLYLLFHQN
ncbi:PucR family transcriptional regulator [Brevibacillus sp. NRS-1366]|uniref:PucR family transcriptional regulator n=1 Tax=Brevibacillus sp. NRS-1366 TaxID=3233899 RepID=UPI003D1B2EDD